MKSAFDVKGQLSNDDHKIVAALERISEAFRVLLWEAAKKTGLSPVQIQILIFLYFHPDSKQTPSHLATEFNVTKATIADSIRLLVNKELITKNRDSNDARSFVLQLTPGGAAIARESAPFADPLTQALQSLHPETKSHLLEGLIQVISTLNEQSVISMPRMCLNCRFLENHKDQHYCRFLEKPLKTAELRIDCPEFEAI